MKWRGQVLHSFLRISLFSPEAVSAFPKDTCSTVPESLTASFEHALPAFILMARLADLLSFA